MNYNLLDADNIIINLDKLLVFKSGKLRHGVTDCVLVFEEGVEVEISNTNGMQLLNALRIGKLLNRAQMSPETNDVSAD